MDPDLTKYPILSYLSRLPTLGSKSADDDVDVEQPRTPPSLPPEEIAYRKFQADLRARMPHLNDPEVIKSMKLAISDVSQTRSVLQSLGDRPDHETVDIARTKISEIEESLSKKIEDLVLGPKPQGVVDPEKWEKEREKECMDEAEKEREMYKAVVRLDEMHEAYENLLRDAEDRLEKIYDGSSAKAKDKGKGKELEVVEEDEEEVNEEVSKILREGEKGMERVDLSERKLKILPDAFGRIRGLVSVNLAGNELKSLPDSIAELERLEELYLAANRLESLPDSIGFLLNLKTLDVSSNKLKALPDSISHCRSLVELNAAYNALMYLPTNLGHELSNLIRLSVQYNKLRSLPTSICEMKSLRYLDAHFNELHNLPQAIGRLRCLEILNLGSNFSDLRELPETFGDLIKLKELDLSNNQIQALPMTFGRLESLVKLNLEQNPIEMPPVEVVKKGVEAVKEFMAKRWVEILVEEEAKSREVENEEGENGWMKRSTSMLTRSTSMIKNYVTDTIPEYLGVKSPKAAYLNEQL